MAKKKKASILIYDASELSKVLENMKSLHLAGDKGAYNISVRDQSVIRLLHDYIVKKLKEKTGFPTLKEATEKDKAFIDTEVKIPGTHKVKNVDIGIIHKKAGPLMLISIKSILSSITNNFTNAYEAAIGDATSLHERYPFLIYCYLILLPTAVLKRKETFDLNYYEGFLKKINLRMDEDDKNKKYEHVCMLVVNFKTDPPQIATTNPIDPQLRIETFIEDICAILKERYEMLGIIKY